MRRVLLGLMLGSLIFGVSFAGARVATVTNPMSSELDAGGYVISHVGLAQVNALQVVDEYPPTIRANVLVGASDPTTGGGVNSFPASLYLRRVDADHGQLWVKTGPNDPDWACVAGC